MSRLFSVLGDSISTLAGYNPEGFAVFYDEAHKAQAGIGGPADTWWGRVIDHFGGTLLKNGSWLGSMVAGAGCPAAWSPERIAALADGAAVPDDVLVFLGTNDYGWGGARAQACGRSKATPACLDLAAYPEEVAGLAPQGALEEFAAAYAAMLESLRRSYPGARVWCLTLAPGRVAGAAYPTHAWNLRGVPMRAYCDAVVEQARAHGCTPVDVARLGYDYEALEGTHPTRLGMAQLADLAVAAMEGRDAPTPGNFAPTCSTPGRGPVDWRSRVWCAGRACVGCAWAKGTGNAWYTACEDPAHQAPRQGKFC